MIIKDILVYIKAIYIYLYNKVNATIDEIMRQENE